MLGYNLMKRVWALIHLRDSPFQMARCAPLIWLGFAKSDGTRSQQKNRRSSPPFVPILSSNCFPEWIALRPYKTRYGNTSPVVHNSAGSSIPKREMFIFFVQMKRSFVCPIPKPFRAIPYCPNLNVGWKNSGNRSPRVEIDAPNRRKGLDMIAQPMAEFSGETVRNVAGALIRRGTTYGTAGSADTGTGPQSRV